MSEKVHPNSHDIYVKAKDLEVVVKFETDKSQDGVLRTRSVKEIICQLILLGQKRGRPAIKEEEFYEAA